MIRHIKDYEDCEVFKPGERWQSPRGTFYYVLSARVAGTATLRTLPGPWASPFPVGTERMGRLRKVPWDGVIGWVRIASSSDDMPLPEHIARQVEQKEEGRKHHHHQPHNIMNTYYVMIPIAGHVGLTVEAESEDDAKGKAFEVAGEALERMLKNDDQSGAEFQNIELLDSFNRGNVCYCPTPWTIRAVEDDSSC